MSFRTLKAQNLASKNDSYNDARNLMMTKSLATLHKSKDNIQNPSLSPLSNKTGKENTHYTGLPKPSKTPTGLSCHSSVTQKEAIIGIIKEETESEIANYASNSRNAPTIKFNNGNYTGEVASPSRRDELKLDDSSIVKSEYCSILKKTVRDLFFDKKRSLEEEFKKKEVYFLGIISELKMRNCDLVESSYETRQRIKSEIVKEEKSKYEKFQKEIKEKLTNEIHEQQREKFDGFKVRAKESLRKEIEKELSTKYEAYRIEAKLKYKALEEKLRKKFKKESGIFVESIQKEMQEILESQGLTSKRRKEIEDEYKEKIEKEGRDGVKKELEEELRPEIEAVLTLKIEENLRPKIEEEVRERVTKQLNEQLTQKLTAELTEQLREQIGEELKQELTLEFQSKYQKNHEEEMEQIKLIVKTQLENKRQMLEESNKKILDLKIQQKFERLKIKFEEEKKILELKLEEERFEFEKKRKLLEIKLTEHETIKEESQSEEASTCSPKKGEKQKEPKSESNSKVENEVKEKMKSKYKRIFEKKEKKYKKIINQLSQKMSQVQEQVKKHFKQMQETRRKEDELAMIEQREELLLKRERELEQKIEEFKIFNQSAMVYSDMTSSQISQISAISRRITFDNNDFFAKKLTKKENIKVVEGQKVEAKFYETGKFGQGDRTSFTPNHRPIDKKSDEGRAQSVEGNTASTKKQDLNQPILELDDNITNASNKSLISNKSIFGPPKPKKVVSSKDVSQFFKVSAENPYLQNPKNSPLREDSNEQSPEERRLSINLKRDAGKTDIKDLAPEITYIEEDSFAGLDDIKEDTREDDSTCTENMKRRGSVISTQRKAYSIKSDRKSVNLLKSIFIVKEKDDANTVSLKRLREHINNLREKDEQFKQCYEDKMENLASKEFLASVLDGRKKDQEIENSIDFYNPDIASIQSKLVLLEDLWNGLFTGYEQRLYLLSKIMSHKDDNFDDFLLRLETNISLEIDFLKDKTGSKKHLLDLLNKREKVKVQIHETSLKYDDKDELENLIKEVGGALSALKTLNLKILGEIERMKKKGVKETDLKVFGIKFDLLARIDIWEEDYMRKVAKGIL